MEPRFPVGDAPSGQGGDRCPPAEAERPPRCCGPGDIGRIDDRPGARGFGGRRNIRQFRENLGLEQVTVPGNQLDDLALAIAQRRSQLADAFEETVIADMNVWPERVHQLLLAVLHVQGRARIR